MTLLTTIFITSVLLAAQAEDPGEDRGKAPRVIEATAIEGEIPFPRVLFITAPDQRRYRDGFHHQLLKAPEAWAAQAPFPFLIPCFSAVNGTAEELLLEAHTQEERSSWNSHQQ